MNLLGIDLETKGLFTPWTMKSSQGPVKFVTGSSWDYFDLHQGENVRVTMKFKVPKNTYFKAYTIH